MKKVLVILGFTASILAVVLAVTPLFKLALFPAILSVFCGISLLYFVRKQGIKTKAIQYIFLLTIIALSFTVYKSIFYKAEIADTKEQEVREEKSEEEALEILEDLEIDE